MINLKTEEHSYLYGFLLADGNLSLNTRNRGRVIVEIGKVDRKILLYFKEFFEGAIHSRKRITNFSNGVEKEFWSWSNHNITFRKELIGLGFPIENKSLNASLPNTKYQEKGFWRGYVDGNGSLGLTSKNMPFISVVTKSENLKNSFIDFLMKFGIERTSNKNKRDSVYNIMVSGSQAKKVSEFLYKGSELRLDRKYKKYLEIKKGK